MEIEFLDGANVLKKQTALPMFHLCKKGMRWLLKQYQREINAVEVDNLANDDGEWETMNEDDGETESVGWWNSCTASMASRQAAKIIYLLSLQSQSVHTIPHSLILTIS